MSAGSSRVRMVCVTLAGSLARWPRLAGRQLAAGLLRALPPACIAVALGTLVLPRAAPAWILSLAIGIAGTLALFPLPVLLGTAPFWDYPHGIVGGSWADMATAFSGYDVYVRDTWRWPLFRAVGLGGDAGVNIIFTDSIPLIASLGRLLFRATGHVVPLYGAWSGLCIIGMALASTALVRALGARTVPASVAAAAIGVSMPALLARWGHLSLMAQGILPLALTFYVHLRSVARPRPTAVLAQSSLLCVLSLVIHAYLFFMVTGISVAAVAQLAVDRRLRLLVTATIIAALAALLSAAIMARGYLGNGNAVSDLGFGIFSANLLSPVIPQLSGLIPGALPRMVDSTGGQYEGFVYLGAGLLLLALFSYAALRNSLMLRACRHPCLLAVLIGFTALAVSNRVYFGALQVITIPMPDALLELAGTVRASGRFAWPGLYAFAALAVASVARRSHAAGPLLLLAAGLQWADAEPLRRMIGVSVSSPSKGVLDTAAWQLALQKVDRVLVNPPFACLPDTPDREWQAEAAIQIQLMAAQAGVATNTLYANRTKGPAGYKRSS